MSSELETLSALAACLGWPPLEQLRHKLPARIGGGEIVWYESRLSDDFFLQINVSPNVRCAAYALHVGMFSGWGKLPSIAEIESSLSAVAAKISCRVGFDCFSTNVGRVAFQLMCPNGCNHDWESARDVDLNRWSFDTI